MPGLSFFDAHCHLQDDRYRDRREEVLDRARQSGVQGFLCCGTGERDWQDVAGLSIADASIIPSFGLHPWFADARSPEWLDILESMLVANPAACCGEIGIDHAGDPATFAVQESVFMDQLKLAARLNRPVTVHCRKAFGRLLELFRENGLGAAGGIIHSYSGPPELVRPLTALGLSISFSGSLTFPNSKRARASAALVQRDRLLIETDSPDIKPFQCATELNEPANVVRVAETLAEIRGVRVEEIAAQTWENSLMIFKSA